MKLFLTICVAVVILVLFNSTVHAQVPNKISYQGLLTTAAGTPVQDGMYKLQFDLFLTSSGGSSLWTELDSQIVVLRGTFNVILGNSTALPGIFQQPLFLQVTALTGPSISSPVTFSPRSALASSAYALGLKTPVQLRDSIAGLGSVVYAVNTASLGIALEGNAPTGIGSFSIGSTNYGGVWGSTTPNADFLDNSGVAGYSKDGYGISGYTDSGTGLLGYSQYGTAIYSWGKLIVNAASGDTAVQLPDNSISAHEILDEPGIAQGVRLGSVTLGTNSEAFTNVDSVSITIPAAGYIVVEAAGQVNVSFGYSALQIDSLPSEALDGAHYYFVGFSTPPSGSSFIPVMMRRVYYRQAGSYIFYFAGANYAGTSNYVWNSVISATYFPTGYGPVIEIIPPAEASQFSQATAVSGERQQGQSVGSQPGVAVDLRELELNAAKAREASEQAQRLLMEAKLKAIQSTRPNN